MGIYSPSLPLLFCFDICYLSDMKKQIKIMTYNIRRGVGMDLRMNLNRVADAIKSVSPQIVCLQEVDKGTLRSFGLNEPAALSYLLDMPHHDFVSAIDIDGGGYGNAIISSLPFTRKTHYFFPGKIETRAMIQCDFGDFELCTAHLSLHDEFRIQAAPTFLSVAQNATKPTIFTGDWNSLPESEFIKVVDEDLFFLSDKKQFTYPSKEPNICIDYIAVDKGHKDAIKLKNFEVVNEEMASDHRPLVATIEI